MNDAASLTIRQVGHGDAASLMAFYNGLSDASRRTFRPLGEFATLEKCAAVCTDNEAGAKYDLVAVDSDEIIGWCFVWKDKDGANMFGLAVADAWQSRRIGSRLAMQLLADADARGMGEIILTVVKDNVHAVGLYERFGFEKYGEFLHEDDGLEYYRMVRKISCAEGSARDSSNATTRR
ncbi:GNAT family N-acetyltransferase [bacterium]|nr:GNAT family N-acetyltransferase [bacterium]